MIINISRKQSFVFGIKEIPTAVFKRCLHHKRALMNIALLFLLMALFLILSTGITLAKPRETTAVQSPVQQIATAQTQFAAKDPIPSPTPSETTITAANTIDEQKTTSSNKSNTHSASKPTNKSASAKKSSTSKPKSDSGEKFLIADYEDPGKPKNKGSFFTQLIDTVINVVKYGFYFGLVLGIGFLAIYGIKLLSTKYNVLTGGGHELINVLEVRYLAPGKAVCLVEVAGKVLVLGLAGNSINSLCELGDVEQSEALKQASVKKLDPSQPFQGMLEKFSKRFSKEPKKVARRPARPRRETPPKEDSNWADDLHSTGENIRQILEDIKEQDKRTKGSRPSSRRNRGEDKK